MVQNALHHEAMRGTLHKRRRVAGGGTEDDDPHPLLHPCDRSMTTTPAAASATYLVNGDATRDVQIHEVGEEDEDEDEDEGERLKKKMRGPLGRWWMRKRQERMCGRGAAAASHSLRRKRTWTLSESSSIVLALVFAWLARTLLWSNGGGEIRTAASAGVGRRRLLTEPPLPIVLGGVIVASQSFLNGGKLPTAAAGVNSTSTVHSALRSGRHLHRERVKLGNHLDPDSSVGASPWRPQGPPPAALEVKYEYEEGVTYYPGGRRPHRNETRILREGEKRRQKLHRIRRSTGGGGTPYVAFDDDYVRSATHSSRDCHVTAFQDLHHPTCNAVHEMDLVRDTGSFIGNGEYREAWTVQQPSWVEGVSSGEDEDNEFVVKMVNRVRSFNGHYHELLEEIYDMIRMDAMVMDIMTPSPRIINVYGHCALTIFVEKMMVQVEDIVVPSGSSHVPPEMLNDADDVDPQNDLPAEQKLHLALDMARSIADLHGYKDGVIVHDDVQMQQFFIGFDGNVKLTDFNRAEVMFWDEVKEEYCPYSNGGGCWGNYRAPEEYMGGYLDEKIDVYSMGNLIYGVLTGLTAFYNYEDDGPVQDLVKEGHRPYIDDRYRTRSFAEAALIDIAEHCWVHDPNVRPSIFKIVERIEEAVSTNSLLRSGDSFEEQHEDDAPLEWDEEEQSFDGGDGNGSDVSFSGPDILDEAIQSNLDADYNAQHVKTDSTSDGVEYNHGRDGDYSSDDLTGAPKLGR